VRGILVSTNDTIVIKIKERGKKGMAVGHFAPNVRDAMTGGEGRQETGGGCDR
jgi:hypothetical protein